MRKLAAVVVALSVFAVAGANAQTAAPAPAKAAPTVRAIQPGLFEVAGPRVGDAAALGITKITATTASGPRAIQVDSPWGASFFGWPKNVKPVAFTITRGKGGTATISAPGFTEANKGDYKAAIDAVVPFAIRRTTDAKDWMTGSRTP